MPTSYKIKLIKKLGQNFLHDENILRRIADAANIDKDEVILEIGTGTGNLTKYLCEKAKFVYAVEKDIRLCKTAEENLAEFKNVKVICGDILRLAVSGLWSAASENQTPSPPWPAISAGQGTENRIKIIGNLPYYITTPIIFKLLDQRKYISDITIMVQKEVAQRIVAAPGGKDYGILSCSVQFYTKPEILFHISKSAFHPQPKVDSTLLRLKPLEKPAVLVKDEEKFLKLIKAAFSQRRKTLSNSLSSRWLKEGIHKALKKSGIDGKRRAETLSLDEFARLSSFLL